MSTNELHPNVQRFKEFVDDHPRVKEQIRKNHKLIQSYYEKWMILGAEDPFWESLPAVKNSTSSNKKDWFKQLGALMEDLDWEEVSRHMEELNGALGQFQQFLSKAKKDSNKDRRELEYPYY
ncbi:MAG: spore coat protein YlbD [Halobacillus sp.]|uniref:spore coat protein YlbD n=1 Tax=Halobacillus sp. TaxID=56800 RepID=UPI003BAF50EC